MSLFDTASLVNIPSAYKAAKAYSIKPTTGVGDFTVARASVAARVNSNLQLEEMAANVPRLNYTSGTSCPHWLLEPQRTNIVLFPISFDDVYWTKSGSSVVSGQDSPSVDYSTDAFKLVEDGSNATHGIFKTAGFIPIGTHSISMFAKKGERDYIALGNGSDEDYAFFNLDTGVIVSTDVALDASSITALANDWYLCTVTLTIGGSKSLGFIISDDGINKSYQGDSASGIYIYGAQLEEGSYPTSLTYAGTEGSTVTRTADAMTGAGNAALFNSPEGVLYVEVSTFVDLGERRLITLSDGTTTNKVKLQFDSDGVLYVFITDGSAIAYNYDLTVLSKIALRWGSNVSELFIDGISRGTGSYTVTPSGMDRVNLSKEDASSQHFEGKVKGVQVYNEALTDAQLTSLTT
jgi:hypothetical protein